MARQNPTTGEWEDDDGNPVAPPADEPSFLGKVANNVIGTVTGAGPAAVQAVTGAAGRFLDSEEPKTAPQRAIDVTKPLPPPPARQQVPGAGPVVSTHVGNTTVQQPIGANGVVQRTSGGTSRTFTKQTPEAREAEKEWLQTNKEAQNLAAKAKQQGIARAHEEVAFADAKTQHALARQEQTAAITDWAERETARREAAANDEEAKWKQAAFESQESKNTFWARQDTGFKVKSGISLLLGIVGGLNDGSNVGAQNIAKAIDADSARYKEKLQHQEDVLKHARGDVTAVRERLAAKRELLDLRTAAGLDAVVSVAEARARRLGIDEAEIKGNVGINQLREQSALFKQKVAQERAEKIQIESARTISTGGANGTMGKPLPGEVAEKLTVADTGLETIARMRALIQQNPQSWTGVAENKKNWAQKEIIGKVSALKDIRSVMQATGKADIAEEQGLKTPEQRDLYTAQAGLNTALAKARGGAITAGDDEAVSREQAVIATTPAEKLKQLDRLEAVLRRGRSTLLAGHADPAAQFQPQGAQPQQPQAPAGAVQTPPQIPGAKLQRNPKTGAYRYVYEDGRIQPVGAQ